MDGVVVLLFEYESESEWGRMEVERVYFLKFSLRYAALEGGWDLSDVSWEVE